jgi:hypothetical protein
VERDEKVKNSLSRSFPTIDRVDDDGRW